MAHTRPPRPQSVNASLRLRGTTGSTPTVVYLEVRQGAKRLRTSTGIKVLPKAWNANNQRLKVIAGQLDAPAINLRLSAVLDAVSEVRIDLERAGTTVTPETLLEATQAKLHPKSAAETQLAYKDANELQAFWRKHVETHPALTEGTRKTYRTALNQLLRHRPTLCFADVTLDTYRSIVAALRTDKLKDSSIGRAIAKLKAVMRAAEESGIAVPPDYRRRSFRVFPANPDTIALTEAEVQRILAVSGLTEREDAARVWFIVACRTGLRFGDLMAVRPEHFGSDRRLRLKAEKTGEACVIPVHPYVAEVLPPTRPEVWPRRFPNQELNRMLKRVALAAGLTDLRELDGAAPRPLWELITAHTARRTFATALLRHGATLEEVRSATGHKTEQALRRYLRMGAEEKADRLATSTFFQA